MSDPKTIATKIVFTKDGFEDSIILEASTLKELRQKAEAEMAKRNPDDWWSELA